MCVFRKIDIYIGETQKVDSLPGSAGGSRHFVDPLDKINREYWRHLGYH